MSPLGRYIRARLHRRIFMWFGASILLTGVAVAVVMSVVGRTGGSWYTREVDRARTLTGHLFARVWDSPAERDALARAVAEDLEVNLTLSGPGPERAPIAHFGPPCQKAAASAPVLRDGVEIGHVAACASATRERAGSRGPLWIAPILVFCSALWAASRVIARRIARPLGAVAQMAQEIGAGNLSSRVRLDFHRHGEVGVVAEAMNDMAARIEQQLADQRELLAAVSHELRTPLARLRLLTEMARDAPGPQAAIEGMKKTLDEIDREVMEIDALVGDLLASSRIDFAALHLHALDAEEAARRALERAGEGAERLAPPASPILIEADATLLGRALANLIDNARKHGGGVAAVRVVSRREGRVAFEVDDGGPGFLGDGEQERVFEPFYRRGEGGREAGSLGLGLALVKRIAEAHRGRAYAENRPGGGARVGIELPAASRTAQE